MPIYTKKGDKGETGLFDGKRLSKNDAFIETIGEIDELNCAIGLVEEDKNLQKIQQDLFEIGGKAAGFDSKINLEERVKFFESEIDRMWQRMPPLKNFILPNSQLHLARVVCRRAERAAVRAKLAPEILKYLNRLSDYLFCLARWVNFKSKIKETVWTISN